MHDDRVADVFAPELAWFAAIAHHQQLTAAANEVGVSQPTLSRALDRWEARLGVALVSRTRPRLTLTRHGRQLRQSAECALAVLGDAAPDERAVFGFLNTLGPTLVPDLLLAWRSRHSMAVSLRQGGTGSLLDELRRGEMDLALVSPPPDDPDLEHRAVFDEPLHLVMATDHPLAVHNRNFAHATDADGVEPVDLADLGDEPVLALPAGYGLRTLADRLYARAGLRPRIALESTDTATLRGLAAAGFGTAILPPSRPPSEGIDRRITDPEATRTIALSWAARRPLPPPARSLRDYILTHL